MYLYTVQRFKIYISTGLLTVFLALQLSVLHQFAHDDSTVTCTMCTIVQHVQSVDYTAPIAAESIDTVWIFVCSDDVKEYAFAKAEQLSFFHLSRPPPINC